MSHRLCILLAFLAISSVSSSKMPPRLPPPAPSPTQSPLNDDVIPIDNRDASTNTTTIYGASPTPTPTNTGPKKTVFFERFSVVEMIAGVPSPPPPSSFMYPVN